MIIKQLSESNTSEIADLHREHFADGWTENMLVSAWKGGRFLALGAIENDVLVGVITCSKGLDDADIEGVVSRTDYRGKGIATALISQLISHLKSQNIDRILLEVRENNLPAINLYKKMGFETISVRKGYYADGENALVMIKENI